MKELLDYIEDLKKSKIADLVDSRIKEFEELFNKNSNEIFKELCFCILTANFNAESGIKIQKKIDNGFLNLSEKELAARLNDLGYRFPNTRARFIIEARRHKDNLKEIIKEFKDENELREWLVNNIKGVSWKESSHFCRNISYKNLAIIDFHIIDILVKNKLIKKPKTLTKNKYLEIEDLLREIGKKVNLNLAELDLYLWFIETGKVLK